MAQHHVSDQPTDLIVLPEHALSPTANTLTLPSPGTALVLLRRGTVGAVLLLATLLDFWNLASEGYANTYYAATVKSMLMSWHNFFFVSFDPGGFLAADKPPLGLWLQVASAKLLGFNGISLLLPQALAGVLSVALLYLLVARVFGYPAGLLAALALALTPIAVVDNRNNTSDSVLILTLLLAIWAVTRAMDTGRLRWLLLGAVFVGLGFNVKELQAYLVLPALFLAYLLGSPVRFRTRLWHLILAGATLLVVSFCWIVAVDLTPAGQRPYVTDSGTNSELSLALGYNGLGRLTAGLVSHLPPLPFLHVRIDLAIAPGISTDIGNPGFLRLFDPAVGGQASWLLALALVGLVFSFVRLICVGTRSGGRTQVAPTVDSGNEGHSWPGTRRGRRQNSALHDQGRALLLWGTWLLTTVGFFSVARFYHLYYLIMLAPAVAALAGIGIVALWNDFRESLQSGSTAWWKGWALPIVLLLTAVTQAHVLAGYAGWNGWLGPLIASITALLALILVAVRLRLRFKLSPELLVRPGLRTALVVTAAGTATLLVAPSAWAAVSVANGNGGAWLPQAGPSQGFGGFGNGRSLIPAGRFGPGRAAGFPFHTRSGQPFGQATSGRGSRSTVFQGFPGRFARFRGFGGPGGFGSQGALTFAGNDTPKLDPKLLSYLESHRGKTRFLVATMTSSYASLFILDTGQPVMTLGGYQGWDRILTPAQLARLVANNTIRFFLIPATRVGGGSAPGGRVSATQRRVTGTPNADPGGAVSGPAGRFFGGPGRASNVAPGVNSGVATANVDLETWVRSQCTAVPASKYQTASRQNTGSFRAGFDAGGAGQLYDCAR